MKTECQFNNNWDYLYYLISLVNNSPFLNAGFVHTVEEPESIKPCPFCGRGASLNLNPKFENSSMFSFEEDRFEDFEYIYQIRCNGCGASIRGNSKYEIIKQWNQRGERKMIICDKCGARVSDLADALQAKFPQITITKTTGLLHGERLHLCHDCEQDFWKWLTNDYILTKRPDVKTDGPDY